MSKATCCYKKKSYLYKASDPFGDNSCIAWVLYNFNDNKYINGINGSDFNSGNSGVFPPAPSSTSYPAINDIQSFDIGVSDNAEGALELIYNTDNEYTISGLFYNPTVDSDYNDEFFAGNTEITNGNGDIYATFNKNGYLVMKSNDGNDLKWYWPSDFLDDWHLITIVVSGSKGNGTISLYIDGNLVQQETRGSYDSPGHLGLLHLWDPKGYNMGYRGSWADFRVFNKALSDNEISLMASTLI
jgi:hypothetical protein